VGSAARAGARAAASGRAASLAEAPRERVFGRAPGFISY